ncbi:hypothetical protein JTE90_007152 [Oedothorax gibbosus]|uniref:Ribosome receptor lysine/proline rich domain-containing protein n=1 Tax=Oedothorax gibbosus TaxID=931172 RepID=A0AAV6UYE2_9ARAC|nr:hypothetical protein JTE90_007152 [Oedothorax gibbosus]
MESAMYTTLQSSPLLMVVAACTVVPFLIYLVYKFSIKEKSFEEVLEEQKRRSLEEEQRIKSEKGKKEKKFKRSWTKKKEKSEPEPENVPQQQEIPQIEIVEPKQETSPNPAKEVKSPKQKNKKSNSVDNQTTEAVPEVQKPKKAESVEKSPQEKKKVAPVKEKEPEVKASPKTQVAKAKEVVEKVPPSQQVQTTQTPVNSAPKKKKKEQVDKEAASITALKVKNYIEQAELDTEEIQNIIDVLLNKQKDSTGWTKPNDQLADTKKHLQERQQQLDQEQRQNQAVVSKLKELREEYNQLKTRYTQLEKSSQEKLQKQQQDIQVFTNRLKQLQEQCNVEKEKSAKLEKHVEEKVSASLKTVEDEKVKLQQKLSKLESESKSDTSKAEVESLKKSREDLQKVHALLIDQHTQLVSSHKNCNAQLAELKKRCEEVTAKNGVLVKEIQSFKDQKLDVGNEKKVSEEKLLAAEKRLSDLDAQVKQLTAKTAIVNQLQLEVKNLQSENERLTEQLVSTKERVAGDGQEILHQNGEMNGKAQDLKSLEEKDILLKEKENVLVQLNEDLNKLKAKVTLLDEETEVQKKKNNELREKNWKAMDALKKVEENAEQKIQEIQTASAKKLSQVQKDYEDKLRAASVGQANGHSEQEAELAKRLSDYNGELEKNKKLATELESCSAKQKEAELRLVQMDKGVQDLHNQIEEHQTRTRECLQRLHPEVSIDSSLSHEAWVEKFVKDVERLLATREAHFKGLLSDTEAMLHKLQESADASEVKWMEKLTAKEEEYQKVLQENIALSKEKKEYESTFQQIEQLKELQDKLKELQSTLESAENERSHTEQKYEEVNKNCINLRDQLANKEKELQELQKDDSTIEPLRLEIEDLKSKLEKEKKINKDFSSQMVRLHSLVKIGTDSLAVEEEKVKKLEKQLEAAQVAATNGGTQTALASPIKAEDVSVKK